MPDLLLISRSLSALRRLLNSATSHHLLAKVAAVVARRVELKELEEGEIYEGVYLQREQEAAGDLPLSAFSSSSTSPFPSPSSSAPFLAAHESRSSSGDSHGGVSFTDATLTADGTSTTEVSANSGSDAFAAATALRIAGKKRRWLAEADRAASKVAVQVRVVNLHDL